MSVVTDGLGTGSEMPSAAMRPMPTSIPPRPGLSQTISAERTHNVRPAANVASIAVTAARREKPSATSTPATMATTPAVDVQPKPMSAPIPTSAIRSVFLRRKPTVADMRRVPIRTPKPSSKDGARNRDAASAMAIARYADWFLSGSISRAIAHARNTAPAAPIGEAESDQSNAAGRIQNITPAASVPKAAITFEA